MEAIVMEDSKFERSKDEDSSFMEQMRAFTGIRLKAPEDFAETVMNSIYRFRKAEPDRTKTRIYFSTLYRNLGVSLVLASIITVIFFPIPKFSFYQTFTSNDIQGGSTMQKTYGIMENLAKMNTGINSIFNSINKSINSFKEGT
jgi:hypothetical protein